MSDNIFYDFNFFNIIPQDNTYMLKSDFSLPTPTIPIGSQDLPFTQNLDVWSVQDLVEGVNQDTITGTPQDQTSDTYQDSTFSSLKDSNPNTFQEMSLPKDLFSSMFQNLTSSTPQALIPCSSSDFSQTPQNHSSTLSAPSYNPKPNAEKSQLSPPFNFSDDWQARQKRGWLSWSSSTSCSSFKPKISLENQVECKKKPRETKIFPCPSCNKMFHHRYSLTSHFRVHTTEKPFECHQCGYEFARLYDRNRHEKLHLDTKPFVCQGCAKRFSRKDALNRHLRTKRGCSRIIKN
ncbi:hypothetical protein G6F56_010398 [Rhizopus delemar]|nr:hypothetical protein G6F56_010398 [Rhizopus delemar]